MLTGVLVELEIYSFSNKRVQNALANVALLQADVTANDEIDQELMAQLELFGPPAIQIFGSDRSERASFHIVRFVEAEAFTAHIYHALSDTL